MRLILFFALLAGPAFADLRVCNESDIRASVAIGYSQDDDWVSEGWWPVDPGECARVITGDLPKRYYYWRATSTAGAFPQGDYSFCTQSKAFTIKGDADCKARGYDAADFNEEDIGEAREYTITLRADVAPKDSARKQAAPAPPPQTTPDNGPGTYGEPLSLTAVLDGCYATGEVMECSFYADGWWYTASEEGPTPLYLIDRMAALADGERVELSGDLISYSGDRAQIMIRDFALAAPPATQFDGLKEFLQGHWEDDAGTGTGWTIQGTMLRWIHDANIAEEYAIEVHPTCAASEGRGPVIIGWPQFDPSMGPSCFLVVQTGPRHLLVQDMVEGGTISFSYSN